VIAVVGGGSDDDRAVRIRTDIEVPDEAPVRSPPEEAPVSDAAGLQLGRFRLDALVTPQLLLGRLTTATANKAQGTAACDVEPGAVVRWRAQLAL
jgi:hypothetical protein